MFYGIFSVFWQSLVGLLLLLFENMDGRQQPVSQNCLNVNILAHRNIPPAIECNVHGGGGGLSPWHKMYNKPSAAIIMIVTNEFPKCFRNVKNLIKIIWRVMRLLWLVFVGGGGGYFDCPCDSYRPSVVVVYVGTIIAVVSLVARNGAEFWGLT